MSKKRLGDTCFLTGLLIPSGQYSKEHYVPLSRADPIITHNPLNIFPAIKIINHIKGNLLPCEWEEQKINLCYKALKNFRLIHKNGSLGGIVKRSLENWEEYKITPCKYCLLKCHEYTL